MSILNLQKGRMFNQSGVFGPCRGQLNSEVSEDMASAGASGYRPISWGAVESTKCCLAHCLSPQQTCYDHCGDDDKCKDVCTRQSSLCSRTCSVVDPIWANSKNPYLHCAYRQGCLDDASTAKHCLRDHHDDIMSCCKTDECTPTSTIDCNKLCEWSAKKLHADDGKFAVNPKLEVDNVLKQFIWEQGANKSNIHTQPTEYFDSYKSIATKSRIHPWRSISNGYN